MICWFIDVSNYVYAWIIGGPAGPSGGGADAMYIYIYTYIYTYMYIYIYIYTHTDIYTHHEGSAPTLAAATTCRSFPTRRGASY